MAISSQDKVKQLAEQIAALRKQNVPSAQDLKKFSAQRAFFFGTQFDKAYKAQLTPLMANWDLSFGFLTLPSLDKLKELCTEHGITRVISTCPDLLKKLVEYLGGNSKEASLDNYAGSIFKFEGIEVLFIHNLKRIFSVPYGKFMAERFLSKFTHPQKWVEPSRFAWEMFKAETAEETYSFFVQQCFLIAYDIETKREHLSIDIISFTGFYFNEEKKLCSRSIVIELRDMFSVVWMRKFLSCPVRKVTQNGKYDNLYLLRFNSPATNWFWDTAYLFHSWYAELPKDLGFLNAFFLRTVVYWKDLSKSGDREDYCKYCALDSWATGNVFLAQLDEMPEWAKNNYLLKFRLQFPSLLCEHTGLVRDFDRLESARAEVDNQEEEALESLRNMLGVPGFNPNSHTQVKNLLRVLGCGDLADISSDETHLQKAGFRHPLNKRILDKILDIRGLRKLKSTYLRTEDDSKKNGEGGAKEYKGMILYSLHPTGTESGRNSSKSSSFWCGIQIQNIPAGLSLPKQTLRAPEGFYMAEADLEQAESRDTAYITGDTNLIVAVTEKGDFHSYNASNFFGVPYEHIYDEKTKKKLRKDLRDMSKPINHGANYNMGPDVMIDNMTLPMVWKAKDLLGLPFHQAIEITEHLLVKFHLTYPKLRGQIRFRSEAVRHFNKLPANDHKLFAPGTYYEYAADSVRLTNKLTSRAFHHTEYNLSKFTPEEYIIRGDWTRYCFGRPWENKLDLNSYAAHGPQSLNARTLDEAFMQVFYKVALPNPQTFRLNAQIHDSILHCFKIGHEHLSREVAKLMEIPVSVRDISGITRTFTVPAAIKAGKDGKGVTFWSDTE
jgi:DNA polymerase I-like protein with 3'-5' exonuclease and polymerase domains